MKKFRLEKEDFSRPFVGVGAVIFKKDEEGKELVLLGKRKNIAGSGKWHVPGGHLKMGESFKECVRREVFEETGLEVEAKEILWVQENFENVHHVNLYFRAEIVGEKKEPENREPEKCEEWRWFEIDNLPELWTLQEFFKQHKNRTRIKNFGRSAKDYIGLGVAAVIMNDKGRVLMQKRGRKASNEVGKWKFPGGKVEYGEKVEEALKREIKEELGVEIKIERFIFNLEDYIPEEGEYWFVPFYLCKIKEGKVRNMELEKCEEIGWFEIDDLPENAAHGTDEIINKLKEDSF